MYQINSIKIICILGKVYTTNEETNEECLIFSNNKITKYLNVKILNLLNNELTLIKEDYIKINEKN